ncbi:CDGP domain-containing protein [Mycolicibacterium mucogenicum]|uniref:CDGP domain-containing protein n=1 Tax=Mycolicibacterium mucogenicum DSM 44124 TaxID=1226753 RepID=A0A8H2JH36_MYCMU|nr:hypothetical protein MMUC44124_16385 [Mycolicibacterium mucogenicum DSM 44124]
MRLLIITGVLGAAITAAPASHALPPNCVQQPWGFLGSQVRTICDDPIRADGSWMRARVIGVPRHYEYPSSSCSGSAYYSNCTFYPGGWVEAVFSDREMYEVRPETVLPDEPGHLPG